MNPNTTETFWAPVLALEAALGPLPATPLDTAPLAAPIARLVGWV